MCICNEEFELYMPPSFPELFDYDNYLKSLDKMLGIAFDYLCMGHFGRHKRPRAKQIIRRATEVAKEWKEPIVYLREDEGLSRSTRSYIEDWRQRVH